MTSLLSTELGTTRVSPPKDLRWAERQLISFTSPEKSPISIWSPTSKGRSIRSMTPEKRFPRGSWRARPTTMELTPRAARAPDRSFPQTVE